MKYDWFQVVQSIMGLCIFAISFSFVATAVGLIGGVIAGDDDAKKALKPGAILLTVSTIVAIFLSGVTK